MSSTRTYATFVLLVLLVTAHALTLVACGPPPRPPITVPSSPAVQQLQLENGLLVVLDPDATATSALVHVRYYAGAKDDPIGRAGLANLVEHLTFAVPSHPGEADRYASLARVGALDISGVTAFDSTDFRATVSPSALAYALWVEASRMAHPVDAVDAPALQVELAAVRNELRSRAGAQPYVLADELLAETLFGSAHPYGRIAHRTRGELDDVTLAEVGAFAARHYQPSNATIVVTGQFDARETSALVSRYFGAIRSRPTPAREVLAAPRLARDDFGTFDAPVRSRILAVGWLLPPPEKDGYEELTLARRVIEAELRATLMTKLGLVDETQVSFEGGHLGTMLVVAAKLRGDAGAARTVSEIDRVMSSVGALGRTREWDRFDELRLRVATGYIVGKESAATRAADLQNDLEYAGVVRPLTESVARIQRLHPSDVGGAVKQLVVDANHAVVVLEPDQTSTPRGVRRP